MPGFLQHDDDELAPSETPGEPPTYLELCMKYANVLNVDEKAIRSRAK